MNVKQSIKSFPLISAWLSHFIVQCDDFNAAKADTPTELQKRRRKLDTSDTGSLTGSIFLLVNYTSSVDEVEERRMNGKMATLEE
ncbi:hypothetical protein ACEPAG_9627 [Sanghuangporus baumii]